LLTSGAISTTTTTTTSTISTHHYRITLLTKNLSFNSNPSPFHPKLRGHTVQAVVGLILDSPAVPHKKDLLIRFVATALQIKPHQITVKRVVRPRGARASLSPSTNYLASFDPLDVVKQVGLFREERGF
jgi:hypothetical protein